MSAIMNPPPPPPPARTTSPPKPAVHGPDRARKIEEIFIAALNETEGDRMTFLDAACGEDEHLRREVLELLRANDEQPDFLKMMEGTGMKPEQPGDMIGQYKLREQVGEGGFGTVWVADQEMPVRRRVALKIIKAGMDTMDVIARFELERQALAMMDHPNIAKVLDAGATDTGRPFFVMELVRGIKITDYCDQANLSTQERLKLFIAVCNAAQHAHQKGIIHRDLKPSNILVTLHDGVPVAKVIDFGVAKATQQRLTEHTVYTQFNQMIGTPIYMSPEQAEMSGLDIDTRSDIYSLGVVLYELLAGRTPFDKEEFMRKGLDEIRRAIRDVDPPRPSTALSTMNDEVRITVAHHRRTEAPKLAGMLRGDLDWIVMKAIEKDRSRRYDSASSLAADIQRHLRNEPVLARPPSGAYRFRRLVRRHKTAFAAGTAVAAALVAGTVISLVMAFRAEREAARANENLRQLRETVPAIVAYSRVLFTKGDFEGAVEKLGYAITLEPGVADYRIQRGNFRQSHLRLKDAAADYQAALNLDPQNETAAKNLRLSENLAAFQQHPGGPLPLTELAKLLAAMGEEKRSAAELMPVASLLGREKDYLLALWLDRLTVLPNATDKPLKDRLVIEPSGLLTLDLSKTGVADLTPLKGMPLAKLDLSRCSYVTSLEPLRGMPLTELSLDECSEVRSLEPLRGMPLRSLDLESSGVADIAPLGTLARLEVLDLVRTAVADITPLSQLPLKVLNLSHSKVTDLAPLRGLPITDLTLHYSIASDLSPLAGLQHLTNLDCSYMDRVSDFSHLSALQLTHLGLQGARVGDLKFAASLPLRSLSLRAATDVRNIRALAGIKTLEKLSLPGDFSKFAAEELDGIEALRDNTTLREITAVAAQTGSQGNPTPAIFWKEWDRDVGWLREVLRFEGDGKWVSRNSDGTWSLTLHSKPIENLEFLRGGNLSSLDISSCAKVSDLEPLRGMKLNTLRIASTAVTSLAPIEDMALRELWMFRTKVEDLSPLRGMPLRVLYMNECPSVTDLSVLADLHTLELILLPRSPVSPEPLRKLKNLRRISYTYDRLGNQPTRSAAEFWREWDAATWLQTLQAGKFNFAPNQATDGTWSLAIRDPAFKEISILKGARFASLDFQKSGITSLQGIETIGARRICLDETAVTEVGPLAAVAGLLEIVLPPRAADIVALRKVTALTHISTNADRTPQAARAPDGYGKPTQTAAEFWQNFDR